MERTATDLESVSGTNAAERCNNEQLSWSSASSQYSRDHPVLETLTTTGTSVTTLVNENHYNCTRTCGTICYAGPTSLELITSATTSTEVITRTRGEDYPVPSPNCTIPTSDCLSLSTKYDSEWDSWGDLPTDQQTITPSPTPPACSACVSTSCKFAHGGMSLYFWPVTTNVSRDYCAEEPAGTTATNLPDPDSSK